MVCFTYKKNAALIAATNLEADTSKSAISKAL
jgi:hypothetical protein